MENGICVVFVCFFQTEDDGGGGLEEEEDNYDALNDETFGAAINGDWEAIHENLVVLDQNGNTNGEDKDETDDGDIADLGTFTLTTKHLNS